MTHPASSPTSRRQAAPARGVRRLLARAAAVGAATVLCATAAGGTAGAVVNGEDSTERYSFMVSVPMTVELENGTVLHGVCGGALIDPQWVITAGHCAQQAGARPTGTVRVGSEYRNSGGSVRTIAETVVHPGYGLDPVKKRNRHDLALLRLDRPVTHKPVRIADRAPKVGAATRVIGFGTTVESSKPEGWVFPERLQQLDTRRAPAAECSVIFEEGELCTTSRKPAAMACSGDSGSPQIQRIGGRWQLVGATSGDGDADRDLLCATGPGIWTSLPVYRDWIEETLDARD